MTCDYCRGVGACPKCWGRANIEELKAERDHAVSLLREGQMPFCTVGTCEPNNRCESCQHKNRVRAFLKEVDHA